MTRTAIVTGGGRGIGRACALDLAEKGCDIVLVDLLEAELARTGADIRGLGRKVATFTADVSDFARAHEIVAQALDTFPGIDILVNNAGSPNAKRLTEITEEEFDRTIAINLKGAFNWCHAVAPHMLRAGSGRIVSISSLNAHTGGVTSAVSKFSYAAAKAGLLGMTRALAKELAPAVHVNAICPGIIETEPTSAMIEARREEFVRGIALGRTGLPADVAQIVSFLALSEPCFITGQDIVVDGFQWVI